MSNLNHDDFWRDKATSEDYADTNIPTEEQVKYLVSNIAPAVFSNDGSILEFGCGYGRLTKEIKKAFPKLFVVGVDINPNIIKQAKKYAGEAKTSKEQHAYPLFYVASDIKGIPPKDAIYCVQVLQHLPNDRKREFFADAAKVINRAGVLVFQYVEGTADSFLTHDAQWVDVSEWLVDAGFEVASVDHNLIQDRWTWVVAVRS